MTVPAGPPVPRVVSWNITKRCNLKCEHCYIDAKFGGSAPAGELSTDECLRVLGELAELNSSALLIITGGEPFLRKDLFRITTRASEIGFMVVIGTNGTVISDRLADQIPDAGIQGLSLSLHALTSEPHDRFVGVQGAWDNTVRGAAVLREHDIPFIIQTSVTPWNEAEIPQIVDKAKALGARVFNLYFLVGTGRGAGQTPLAPDAYEALLETLYLSQKQHEGEMIVNAKCAPHFKRVIWQHDPGSANLRAYGTGCPAGVHYLQITPDGKVTPCPYMGHSVGDLRTQTFTEIWEGSGLLQGLRKADLGGRCGECEFKSFCGGCRCRAYAETGDALAEDPACGYEPGTLSAEPVVLEQEMTFGIPEEFRVRWTPEARERLQSVPSFARGMVIRRVERYAEESEIREITPELMAKLRDRFLRERGGKVPFAFWKRGKT